MSHKVPVFVFGALLWAALGGVAASEVATLQKTIDGKAAEAEQARTALADAEQALARLEAEQQALEAATDGLAAERDAALAALEAQFERVVADPDTPLQAELQAYRAAAAAQARHGSTLTAQQEQIAAARTRLSALRTEAETAAIDLATLRAGLDRARAQRLLRELNVDGEQRLTNAISCAMDETIADCMARGEQTARRVARNRFAQDLFAQVTEAEVVAKHQVAAGVEPQVVESTITDSGFRGQGEYFVTMTASLRTEATLTDACRLLGLSEAECQGELPPDRAAAAAAPVPATPPPEVVDAPDDADPDAETVEPAAAGEERYQLTVRSNVYYDEVFIDGVPYGSTKLDVMLPPGEYDIEVRKPGHTAYRERIELNGSRTLRAQLAELAEP